MNWFSKRYWNPEEREARLNEAGLRLLELNADPDLGDTARPGYGERRHRIMGHASLGFVRALEAVYPDHELVEASREVVVDAACVAAAEALLLPQIEADSRWAAGRPDIEAPRFYPPAAA